MSRSILIEGQPAMGKTCSLRSLDPKTTFWLDCDGKGDQWKGFGKEYNKDNGNYYRTKSSNTILQILKKIDEEQKQIKVVVIDTINSVMTGMEFESKKEGFSKWTDIADFGYNIVQYANKLRDDLVVIMLGHTAVTDEGYENLITNGRKLEKIQLTASINAIILAKRKEGRYKFIIRSDNSSARIPMGYFEGVDEIDNDIALVFKELEIPYGIRKTNNIEKVKVNKTSEN